MNLKSGTSAKSATQICAIVAAATASMISAAGDRYSDWSAPVHLGPVVNSSSNDFTPALSPDGLSLYFSSDRLDGFGGFDIWVSRRDCESCPWEPPVPLGPNINTAGDDFDPAFSPSGHLLFFVSDRQDPGAQSDTDIWVSFRRHRHDDFGWSAPINLGPHVNTNQHETSPAFLPGKSKRGGHTLYFVGGDGTPTGTQGIFEVGMSRLGIAHGPAVPVMELNATGSLNGDPSLRRDGLEIFFFSNRQPATGGTANIDVWTATRSTTSDPWSPPVNLGPPVNTRFAEISVTLSFDGTQLFLSKGAQAGGLGLRDLWVSTRERIDDDEGEREEDDD